MIRLDYLSCVLTVVSTILVKKKMWHGWAVAAVNSLVLCAIGIRTRNSGLFPLIYFVLGYMRLTCHGGGRRWKSKGLRPASPASSLEFLSNFYKWTFFSAAVR